MGKPAPAMDKPNPVHDDIVAKAVGYRRAGNLAALPVMFDALRSADAYRFTTERCSDTCTLVLDTWDDCGRIVDSYGEGRPAELDANRRNTLNIRDGQRHLREQLAAATQAGAA